MADPSRSCGLFVRSRTNASRVIQAPARAVAIRCGTYSCGEGRLRILRIDNRRDASLIPSYLLAVKSRVVRINQRR
jgi:hypothetical protein